MNTKIIGVYGTLRKNERAHYLLKEARYIKTITVSCPFILMDTCWGFPTLTPSNSPHNITLELYEISINLEKQLDRYEGFPELYNKVYSTIDNNTVMLYVMNKIHANFKIIESGDWKTRKQF